jgi:hypothetical protein
MMQYTIAQDHYVPEFDIQMYVGGVVYDGDLEPDLIAQLVSQGVLVSESPAPVEEEISEKPVSRRRHSPDSDS